MFRKNVSSQFIHVQGVDASTGGIKAGVTWTVRRCIDGTFAAATGTATEDGSTGWYKFALSQADTNGNNIGFNFTGSGAVPQTVTIVTTACDPTSTAFGLSIAKTTNITGFNDIAATAVVSSGAITTSGGAVSTVTTTTTATNVTTVNGLAANVITAASINADAITAAKIADGAIDANTFAAGAITASAIAADAIGASELAADAATEIANAVWDTDCTARQTQGTFGQAIGDPVADTNTIFKAVVTDATGATVGVDVAAVLVDTAEIGAAGAGLTVLATQASVDVIDGNVDSILVDTAEIGAAGAGLTNINLPNQTMDIIGSITGNLSGSVGSVTGTIGGLTAAAVADLFDTDSGTTYASAVAGSVVKEIADNAGGGTPPSAADIADAVWEEAQADHASAGTFGEVATEVAAILVDTAEIGAAGAGLTVLATQASVNTIDGIVDAIVLDTAEIGAAGAGLTNINLPNQTMDIVGSITGNLSGSVGSVTGAVGSVTGISAANVTTALSEVTAIKAKTDSLTFTVATMVDANIQAVNDITVTGDGAPGTEWGP